MQQSSVIARAAGVRAWRTPADLRAYQQERLRHLIEHAYANVPYYHALFQHEGITPAHIRMLTDLNCVPVSTKDELRRQALDDVLASGLCPDRFKRIQR